MVTSELFLEHLLHLSCQEVVGVSILSLYGSDGTPAKKVSTLIRSFKGIDRILLTGIDLELKGNSNRNVLTG